MVEVFLHLLCSGLCSYICIIYMDVSIHRTCTASAGCELHAATWQTHQMKRLHLVSVVSVQ